MKPVFLFLTMVLAAGTAANAQSASKTELAPSGRFPMAGPGVVHQLQLTAGGALGDGRRPDGSNFTRGFFELGLQQLHNDGIYITVAHGLALELSPGRQQVYGLRYGGWISYTLFGFGLHGVYYTDFAQKSFRLRPELMLAAPVGRLAFGYDCPLAQSRDFTAVRNSNIHVSLTIHMRLRQLANDGKLPKLH